MKVQSPSQNNIKDDLAISILNGTDRSNILSLEGKGMRPGGERYRKSRKFGSLCCFVGETGIISMQFGCMCLE